MAAYFGNFTNLFLQSAPWLLLGFFIGGLIHGFISTERMNRHLGGNSLWSTVKAAFIGAPLPLCSCGVVPTALGLRRSGASKNATVSFLVATPETGVDSISVTYALMGPMMALMRPIAAITSAIVAGTLVGRKTEKANIQRQTACKKACGSKKAQTEKTHSAAQKFISGLKFSYIDMLDDTANWLLIGLLFAAAVQAFVPESFFTQWGSSWLAFVVMAMIGIPMYICATASTPIAAGFLFSGVSPGAVLIFMLVGPATNLGTIAIIRRELGQRALIAYLTGVVVTGFLFAYITNLLAAHWPIQRHLLSEHHVVTGWVYLLSAVVLAVLLLASIYRQIKHKLTSNAVDKEA
ncbi:MAG: SO_0444 family Cu/Zn efflux transporter [Gammaproteobacteria bacterium]|nr:SO_0444 family Cu/Zn efflux transporter [Gammaproteobacteria bacterium]